MKKEVILKVNGVQQQVMANPEMVLIDLLREDLRLTGTKQSCDRKGQCGACTVHLDGRAVKSCLMLAAQADGDLAAWSQRCIHELEKRAGELESNPLKLAIKNLVSEYSPHLD